MTKSLPGDLRARLKQITEGIENKQAPKEPKPARPKSKAQSFKDLDMFLEEARAGMPDEALCRAAGVSMTSVLEWRRAREIRRTKSGHDRKREIEVWALDPFGDWTPEVQEIDPESSLNAQWDIPTYVLRNPLNYDLLARSLYFLHVEQGTSAEALAKAFGLRERDVENAILVETAHLNKNGIPCKTCGRPCDPAYGKRCSTRCKK